MQVVADRADKLLQQARSENIPGEVNQSLNALQETLKDFQSDSPMYADVRESLDAIEILGQSFRENAPVYEDLRQSLKAIEQLTGDFQNGAPVYEDIRRSLQAIETNQQRTAALYQKLERAPEYTHI